MLKAEVMSKFGLTDQDEFETLLLDLGIDPETEELSDEQVETVKNHVVVYATAVKSLPATSEYKSQTLTQHQGKLHALSTVTNQGLQLAKETGLNISQGALETLAQITFDQGRLDAAFLEKAYWLGLLRQQNQLRAQNVEKFAQVLKQQQSSQFIDLENLAQEAGLLSNEELVKNLSNVSVQAQKLTAVSSAVVAASAWI